MLILKKVNRVYKQGSLSVHAVDNVDLQVEDGEFLAITGPSGSGKTTLLNCIGTIDQPTSGELFLGERDLVKLRAKEQMLFRRRNLGFVFQSYHLLPVLTVFENIAVSLQLLQVAPAEVKQRCDQIIDQVGLSKQSRRLPSELSGGQQQRVAIARALVKKPQLLLADEPTAHLDSGTALEILDLMSNLNKELGITVIFSTHDPQVVSSSRRKVILSDGRIISDEAMTGK